MTEPSIRPTWQVMALVGRVGSREILVHDRVGTARLPTADRPTEIEPYAADAVAVVETMLMEPVVPLRLTWLPTEHSRSGTIVVEVEPLDAAPSGFGWRDPSDVIEALATGEVESVVRRRMNRMDGEAAPLEPPWARQGWFARTAAWMVERMGDVKLPVTEPPRMVYQGPLAAVLRARSGERTLFLKCAAPAFAHEASITHAIWRRTPDAVPTVIASDPGENWLLMNDHGGRLLEPEPGGSWIEALRRVAELQRAWIGSAHEVSAAGGQMRPLEHSRRPCRTCSIVTISEVGWHRRFPRGLGRCRTEARGCLRCADRRRPPGHAGSRRPPSRERRHHAARLLVVDWSDAAVGNPFIDLATLLVRTTDRDLRRRLLEASRRRLGWHLRRVRLGGAGDVAVTVGAPYQVGGPSGPPPALDVPDAPVRGRRCGWANEPWMPSSAASTRDRG